LSAREAVMKGESSGLFIMGGKTYLLVGEYS
jgi:hypothetical protein